MSYSLGIEGQQCHSEATSSCISDSVCVQQQETREKTESTQNRSESDRERQRERDRESAWRGMGQLFQEYLAGDRVYCCRNCKTHAATHDQIVAKAFQGRFGPAYLFNTVVNVCLGPNEDRVLMTGRHTVNDIHCCSCFQVLGWRYEKAYEEKEKYKEGKYIMEKTRMIRKSC